MVSIAEVYAHLSIECPSGFLQAEVVVQLLVRKVPALEREVVASVTETVGKAQVVGELARNHVVALVWGIERSGFFNGREKWAKGFENQRV